MVDEITEALRLDAIDVFVDTDLDPWVLRLPDRTLVGSASAP